jgi:hypothetical protein
VCGAVYSAVSLTGAVRGGCGQQRRDQFLLVAERRPQPGGHLVHDASQTRGGSAPPVAATRVLLQPDDECPHAVTISATALTCLKVALRPPARGVSQGDRDDVKFAHAPRVSDVAPPRFAVPAQPELSGDERQPGILVVGFPFQQLAEILAS